MVANTSSRGHSPQHYDLVSPTIDDIDQSPIRGSMTKSKVWQTTVAEIPSWPEEPKTLKKHTWTSYFYGFGDVLLALLPVYFILLGVAVILLNGKATQGSSFGSKVERAMELGPTMFPIVFAAVSGRSMKMIARFLAEKGSNIGTLELLMASQSVWGTVESQLLMQRFTIVGANLLFLWALSPLGGQASLRLMNRNFAETSSPTQLRYMTTGPGGTMWGLSSTYVGSGKFADAGALYTAALMAPLSTKLGPEDPWGNVKIPKLESLYNIDSDSSGWIEIPSSFSEPESYSSLVGLPVVGLPQNGTSVFTIEDTYISVNCSRFTQHQYPRNTFNNSINFTKLEELAPGQVWHDKSAQRPFGVSGDWSSRTSFFLDTTRSFPWGLYENKDDHATNIARLDSFVGHYNSSMISDVELNTKRELLYVSEYAIEEGGNDLGLNIAKCTLAQHHVEALINCNGTRCAAVKLRTSKTDTRPTTLTPFEHGTIMIGFATHFSSAVTFNIGSSPTERFISNTSSIPFVQHVGHLPISTAFTDVSQLTPETFSGRLSLVMNTYYQLSTQPTGYFGDLPKNLSAYGPDTLPNTDINAYLPSNLSATNNTFLDWYYEFEANIQNIRSPFIGATTTATVSLKEEIFVCNNAWLALLITSSAVILLTGAIALVLKQKTLGPEMFGFVSSMTYENPWLRIPHGGTMMDGMERARLLKDVEVRIGDVRGDEEVGHIAVAAGVPLRDLERGRLYH